MQRRHAVRLGKLSGDGSVMAAARLVATAGCHNRLMSARKFPQRRMLDRDTRDRGIR
jgi:hypothetical protein